jgi:hypothetical protein
VNRGLDRELHRSRLVNEGCGSRLIRALGEGLTSHRSVAPVRPSFCLAAREG